MDVLDILYWIPFNILHTAFLRTNGYATSCIHVHGADQGWDLFNLISSIGAIIDGIGVIILSS